MYGACTAGPNLQFFVCEYASKGSLSELTNPARFTESTLWKRLHEAALGLEYLHERGHIHGDLRCSNILIGSDGTAKLSNFGLSGSMNVASSRAVRWQAPEVLKGEAPSHQSDVYSLGMCVIEAVTGDRPWGLKDEVIVRILKVTWAPEEINNGSGPDCPQRDARHLAWRMCCQDPSKRLSISSVRYELEQFSTKDNCNLSQPEQERSSSFDEYDSGRMKGLWLKLLAHMEKWDHIQYHQAFDELKKIRELLQDSTCDPIFFGRFHTLLIEFYQMIKMSPEQARMMRLTSTRVTSNSLYAFQWRVNSLLASLGKAAEPGEERWRQQRREQVDSFVSGLSDTFLLLKDLNSSEERSLFLRNLKTELEDPQGKYTADQREVMKKAYEEITSTLESDGGSDLVPIWFIPWYELLIDEWEKLGEGGFGSVYRAKWLDSEVVVKRVILAGSSTNFDTSMFSLSTLSVSADPTVSEAAVKSTKREEALKMFRREVDIWFGFSHPHVIQLFGACHVGRPFFVCEYATNGTLVSYLRKNPDQLWTKLHEAALGIQYLHARGVVHGDLKGNNIVIGSDMKAKVTDFGLSSVASSESSPMISAAWHWLAPECFPDTKAGGKEHIQARPTFASDVYSLGMCIVEAMRVVDAVKLGKDPCHCLPWHSPDRNAVRYNASRGTLPSRPTLCEDNQWELVKRMCALNPNGRVKISAVVDELAKLAIAYLDNQNDNPTAASPMNCIDNNSVSNTISVMRNLLVRLQGSPDRRDPNWIPILSLYVSLWDCLGKTKKQVDGNRATKCRTEFHRLVADANVSTLKLKDTNGNLITYAETTMRYYALDRRLDKLCEAYSIGK